MRVSSKILRKAKALVALSLDKDHAVDLPRVQAILQTLEASHLPAPHLRLLLKTYQRFIQIAMRQTQGVLEYAGAVSADEVDALGAELKKITGRQIKLASSENLDLIAGIRLSFADYVWENSVAHHLFFLNKI